MLSSSPTELFVTLGDRWSLADKRLPIQGHFGPQMCVLVAEWRSLRTQETGIQFSTTCFCWLCLFHPCRFSLNLFWRGTHPGSEIDMATSSPLVPVSCRQMVQGFWHAIEARRHLESNNEPNPYMLKSHLPLSLFAGCSFHGFPLNRLDINTRFVISCPLNNKHDSNSFGDLSWFLLLSFHVVFLCAIFSRMSAEKTNTYSWCSISGWIVPVSLRSSTLNTCVDTDGKSPHYDNSKNRTPFQIWLWRCSQEPSAKLEGIPGCLSTKVFFSWGK